MRSSEQQARKPVDFENGQVRLSAFGEGVKRAPSQKELAGILMVTTRHLRRWEIDEASANRPCSRPYSHADLWRLYQRRGRKGWDRVFAERLNLADIFERFDEIRGGSPGSDANDAHSSMATLMLRSIAADSEEELPATDSIPRMLGAGLANAAKAQLRAILDCEHARGILVKAFFQAALVAETRQSSAPAA